MQRIILSLSLITLVLGALGYGATNAFFSDTETATANVLAAGAIDLTVDNESYYNGEFNPDTSWERTDLTIERFFDFTDLKPDDYGEDTISLQVDTNDTYLCANVTLASNDDNGCTEPEAAVDQTCGDPGADEGELAALVNFLWWADDGDNVLEDDETVISQGNFGQLGVGNSYYLALADSDENIWTGTGGPVPGEETHYIGKAWCFGEIGTAPIDQDDETDAISPADDNDGNVTAGEPEDGGITCDGTLLGNESQTDSLTADVSFEAVQARHNDDFQCTVSPVACSPEQAHADSIVAFAQGERNDGSPVAADRSDENDVLGAPQSNGDPNDSPVPTGEFYALGFDEGDGDGSPSEGGWIEVAFTDNVVFDGPGNDLRIWEITGGNNYPLEAVKIEVSQNGSDWFELTPSPDRDAEADLSEAGLSWASYVRVTDVSDRTAFNAAADGYDVDAISALNCIVEPVNSAI